MQAHALDLFAELVASPRTPSDLSRRWVEMAMLDTLGCILAGVRYPVAQRARQVARSLGEGQAPILGTGTVAASPVAAFANAVTGHASDFDDWEIPGNTHPSVILIPAMLAICGEKRCSGEDVVAAYVAGFEVIARLGLALNFEHYDRGWHSSATLGPMGAAAACARLLGLDLPSIRNALSIAASMAGGMTCQFGSNAKPLQIGFAAQAGVSSALLAAAGMNAQPHALDSPTGFNTLYAHGEPTRLVAALENPDGPSALDKHGLVLKRFPSCGYTHRVMDGALAVSRRLAIEPENIKSIVASLPDFHAAILPFQHPRDRNEALFSVPFCVAAILLDGDLSLRALDRARWRASDVSALIAKVRVATRVPANPRLNYDPDDPDRVEIELTDGTAHSEAVQYPRGAPANPMSWKEICNKFINNVGISNALLEPDNIKCWIRSEDVHQFFLKNLERTSYEKSAAES